MSYRNCAEKLSQTTGLSISHAAVWNVIQALGDKLVHDEKELVETGKKEDLRGSREVPVLFEEEKLEEIKGDILQAGQVKEKIGKGYRYPVIGRMLGLDTEKRGSQEVAFYGGVLKNLCEGLGSARKRRSRGFRWELRSSNEGGRMFEPEGRVCAGA